MQIFPLENIHLWDKQFRPVFILRSLCLFLILGVSLSACVPKTTSAPLASSQPVESTPTLAPTEVIATPSPTQKPSKLILLAAPGSDARQARLLEETLTDFASQHNLQFEKQPEIAEADLKADIDFVVTIAPFSDLPDLAASHPQVQFLAVGIPDIQPMANVSVIGAQGDRPDRQGFIAGYLAAVVTKDWRVGVISLGDTPSGKAAKQGFLNGVVFFCGLCRPAYPPFVQYPLYAELLENSGPEEQQALADYLIRNAMKTVYVFPGVGDRSLLEYLVQKGVNVIGGISPPTNLEAHWVATIRADWLSVVQDVLLRTLQGESGIVLEPTIVIEAKNINLFSPGRQALVDRILAELMKDYIDTGVNPQTGEPR